MDYETINFERQDGVAIIRLNRPEIMNALEPKLSAELIQITDLLDQDPEIRAVILTGTGKAFCAGGDVRRLKKGFSSLAASRKHLMQRYSWVIKFTNMEKPIIAAVNGFAAGAGFSLAMMCDLILASEEARFIQSFVKMALVPDLGSMYFLPRLVGLNKAKELIYTGQVIDAAEAYRLGIVNRTAVEQ